VSTSAFAAQKTFRLSDRFCLLQKFSRIGEMSVQNHYPDAFRPAAGAGRGGNTWSTKLLTGLQFSDMESGGSQFHEPKYPVYCIFAGAGERLPVPGTFQGRFLTL
jgi:hypothetical protein